MFSKYEDRIMSTLGRLNCSSSELMERLYDDLFEAAPDMRSYYQSDTPLHCQKLLDMVLLVVNSFDELPELAKQLEEMGREQGEFGAGKAHYDAIGRSLILALSESVAGWNAQDKQAWTTIYNYISNTMLEGATRAEPVRFLA